MLELLKSKWWGWHPQFLSSTPNTKARQIRTRLPPASLKLWACFLNAQLSCLLQAFFKPRVSKILKSFPPVNSAKPVREEVLNSEILKAQKMDLIKVPARNRRNRLRLDLTSQTKTLEPFISLDTEIWKGIVFCKKHTLIKKLKLHVLSFRQEENGSEFSICVV